MNESDSKAHTDRVAVVTGGGRGLGQVMALALANAGARVVVAGIDAGELNDTVALAPDPQRMYAIEIDVAADDAGDEIVRNTVARFGGLDILVNNAGITVDLLRKASGGPPPTWQNITASEFRKVFDVNTVAPFLISQAAASVMLDRGWGRIVNVTTSLDTMLMKGMLPYGGSKAATEANTVILAEELRGRGITVNVLTPGGPTYSQMAVADGNVVAAGMKKEDFLSPEIMGPPVVWITSDNAAEITATRFRAADWDASIEPRAAAEAAGAPAAWQQLGQQAVWPDRK